MNSLDDPALYRLDASGMFDHISHVGRELQRAWESSAGMSAPGGARECQAVVLAGIGGSATAADYFAEICVPSSPVPVLVARGSDLPAWVDSRTLVVVCSYSGDTAESLACFAAALERGATMMAITRGGALAAQAEKAGVPVHRMTYDAPPRATTVQTLAPLLRLGAALHLSGIGDDEVAAAAIAHEHLASAAAQQVPAGANPAKQLAIDLQERFPMIMGGAHLGAAARRFRNQIAENGKMLAAWEELPEAGHNLIVGLGKALTQRAALSLVMLESDLFAERLRRRFDAVVDLFDRERIPVHRVRLPGAGVLQDLIAATAWGDYVSCYLALLNGEDPTPVPQIDYFREQTA